MILMSPEKSAYSIAGFVWAFVSNTGIVVIYKRSGQFGVYKIIVKYLLIYSVSEC